MPDENLVQTTVISFPETISLESATSLLNLVLTEMQRNRINILSTKHEGGNKFFVEYRGAL